MASAGSDSQRGRKSGGCGGGEMLFAAAVRTSEQPCCSMVGQTVGPGAQRAFPPESRQRLPERLAEDGERVLSVLLVQHQMQVAEDDRGQLLDRPRGRSIGIAGLEVRA